MTHEAGTTLHLRLCPKSWGSRNVRQGSVANRCMLQTESCPRPIHLLKPSLQRDCQNVTIFGERVYKEVIKVK